MSESYWNTMRAGSARASANRPITNIECGATLPNTDGEWGAFSLTLIGDEGQRTHIHLSPEQIEHIHKFYVKKVRPLFEHANLVPVTSTERDLS